MSVVYFRKSGEATARLETANVENALFWQDASIPLPPDFTLESGEKLSSPELRVRLYGDRTKPLVIALGGISAGRCVADADDEKGWWRDIAQAGGAIDLEETCLLGIDFLPNAEEIANTITTKDQARALSFALSYLQLEKAHTIVGASYGGMVALAFAALYPAKVEKLCIISAAERAHPGSTAIRGVQRRILKFASECGRPEEGVALARQLAMTTYRTADEFAERFGDTHGEAAGDPYDVCEYLIARGSAFGMSADRFLTLSDSIDRHNVDPALIRSETLLISALSDKLVPPSDMRRLAAALPVSTSLVEIESIFGHDSFLKETAAIGPKIKSFLEEK